jgi:hypothetical protein
MDLNIEVHWSEPCWCHLTPNARSSRYITLAYSSPGTGGTYILSKGHLGTSVGIEACRHIGTGLSVNQLYLSCV